MVAQVLAVEARSLSRPHRAALTGAAALILLEAALERACALKVVIDQGLEQRPFPGWGQALAALDLGIVTPFDRLYPEGDAPGGRQPDDDAVLQGVQAELDADSRGPWPGWATSTLDRPVIL